MKNYTHLDIDERYTIEHSLNKGISITQIALTLRRSFSSISREIKKHSVKRRTGALGKGYNNCALQFECRISFICNDRNCRYTYCRFCKLCNSLCHDYEPSSCKLLEKSPYVCNGCSRLSRCTLEKTVYKAKSAQKDSVFLLKESRSGISITEDELNRIDRLISPLLKKGQSIHHIYGNNSDEIMLDEKTLYNYVDQGLLSAKNLDLPRKVRYRPRKSKNKNYKVDKKCRIGRTFEDYQVFLRDNPDIGIVEMDTVEGTKGGKVLLTLHFTASRLMLAYIRNSNTSKSVIDIFNMLWQELGEDTFRELFQVILTDNGSEFSNPKAIEFDQNGNRRTRIFYCDAYSSYQKPRVENNHEFIRRVIPKGKSMNGLEQEQIYLMMSHINSYGRRKLKDKSPIDVFSFLHGDDVIQKLGITRVSPNDIILKPKLLK